VRQLAGDATELAHVADRRSPLGATPQQESTHAEDHERGQPHDKPATKHAAQGRSAARRLDAAGAPLTTTLAGERPTQPF
jgi:hypothetical protein